MYQQQPKTLEPDHLVFCHEVHAPTNCTKVIGPATVMNIVKRDKLCFNCLGNHRLNECKSKNVCRKCSKKHHTSLCYGRQTDPHHENDRRNGNFISDRSQNGNLRVNRKLNENTPMWSFRSSARGSGNTA